MIDGVTEAEIAMARLAGIVECPGTHVELTKWTQCRVCQGKGIVSTEGKSTDTIRFWIEWRRKRAD